MFEDILVPTDGSDCAALATDYAEDLATRYDATVHVLSVVDSRTIENAPHYEDLRDERIEMVEGVCEGLEATCRTVDPEVRSNVPHRAILEYVEEAGIDLIVMGTHGRTGLDRVLLGSVTEKVVRLSDVPVLTVRSEADASVRYPYSDILVPTDGSERAEAAVRPAADLARTYDARLHALAVVDTMAMGVDARSEIAVETFENVGRKAVDAVAERARESSVETVETAVEYGNPYREIRSYVDEHDVDLVVMGTHGRSGIERYLLGSVTEKTVRTSPVPVMTVRAPERAE